METGTSMLSSTAVSTHSPFISIINLYFSLFALCVRAPSFVTLRSHGHSSFLTCFRLHRCPTSVLPSGCPCTAMHPHAAHNWHPFVTPFYCGLALKFRHMHLGCTQRQCTRITYVRDSTENVCNRRFKKKIAFIRGEMPRFYPINYKIFFGHSLSRASIFLVCIGIICMRATFSIYADRII